MDDRNSLIRELERAKKADTEGRNRLLEGLGETLLQRIGDTNPFPAPKAGLISRKRQVPAGNGGSAGARQYPEELAADTPGAVLADYRGLEKDIAESEEIIASLEKDIAFLQELEQKIAAKEEEQSGLMKELTEEYIQLGTMLLELPGADNGADPLRQQHDSILAKIAEQERKLDELEEREGGFFSWLGKNAQAAVSRTLLIKNRSALQRLYRDAGEKFISLGSAEGLDGEAAGYAENAREKKKLSGSLALDLAALKTERRTLVNRFGTEGTPPRRIQGLEKHINLVKGEFPKVYLRLGLLAEGSGTGEALSSFITEDDEKIIARAKQLKIKIDEKEIEIGKIEAAISIDNEYAEIERIKRTIEGQRRKISDAEEEIRFLEKQQEDSKQHIAELEKFIKENSR